VLFVTDLRPSEGIEQSHPRRAGMGTTSDNRASNQRGPNMRSSTKKFVVFLVDPKSILFGAAIFALIWACLKSPCFPGSIFLSVLLLVASILIRLDNRWGNLIAAILTGYLPVEFVRAFFMLPHFAEVPMFSLVHFRCFFRNLPYENGFVMFMGLTLVMLTRSVFAVIHNEQSENSLPERSN